MTSVSIVSVQKLSVRYGDFLAVDSVNLEVGPGEIVVLAGANGAGKTSTLESIEGYRKPASGTILIGGSSPEDALNSGTVGVLLQDDGIYPGAKTSEVLDLFVRLHGGRGMPSSQLLELVGLTARGSTAVRRLSGGEHRRLGLALALVGAPEALLLDEPTAGLDAEGRDRVVQLLIDRRSAGCAVLVTTHDFGFADAIADRVVVMAAGRVVASGRPADLVPDDDGLAFTAAGPIDLAKLTGAMGAESHSLGGGHYRIDCPRSSATIARLTAWCAANEVEVRSISDGTGGLEAAIRQLIDGADADERGQT